MFFSVTVSIAHRNISSGCVVSPCVLTRNVNTLCNSKRQPREGHGQWYSISPTVTLLCMTPIVAEVLLSRDVADVHTAKQETGPLTLAEKVLLIYRQWDIMPLMVHIT